MAVDSPSISVWCLPLIILISLGLHTQMTSAQIGLLCTKNSDCKMGSSFICGPGKSCVCDRGHRFDILKLGCVRYIVDHGVKCDPLRDSCQGGPNAFCSATFLGEKATCKCKENYNFDYSTKLCQSKSGGGDGAGSSNGNNNGGGSSINNPTGTGTGTGNSPPISTSGIPPGSHCETNMDCRGYPNATCYSYVQTGKRECDCNYDSHYYDKNFQTCLPKRPMGSQCETTDQCVNLQNIECSKNSKTCSCKTNYYYDRERKRCVPGVNIGETCVNDEQCKARPHSYCASSNSKFSGTARVQSRCACLAGKEYYDGAGTCVDMVKPIPQGQYCMTNDQCQGGVHAVCQSIFLGSNPVCSCKEGYSYSDTSKECRKGGGDDFVTTPGNNDGGGSSSNNNNSPSSSGNTNIDLNLKFDVVLKIVCSASGKCKTSNASIFESTG